MKFIKVLIYSLFVFCLHGQADLTWPEVNIERLTDFSSPEKSSPVAISSDGGESWKEVEGLPEMMRAHDIQAYESELVLVSREKGIWLSSKSRTEWKDITGYLPNRNISALLVQGDDIYVGVYQKGIFKTSSKGLVWQDLNLDLSEKVIQEITIVDGILTIGTDSGISRLVNGKWENTHAYEQVNAIVKVGKNWFAATAKGLLKSIDQGESWKYVHQRGSVLTLYGLGDRLYSVNEHQQIIFSENGGSLWSELDYYPNVQSGLTEAKEYGKTRLIATRYGLLRYNLITAKWDLIYENPVKPVGKMVDIGGKLYAIISPNGC